METGAVQIVANGKPRAVPPGATVADLLAETGLRSEWVVVERNGDPVERRLFASTRLEDGDRLEIVRAVAGG
ncbi:MAG: sulfur carrier protein ThiS [Acidobacteria bacterium]|nr:sulfur carrier protein ThiS [Acidobacteriota bacterium]